MPNCNVGAEVASRLKACPVSCSPRASLPRSGAAHEGHTPFSSEGPRCPVDVPNFDHHEDHEDADALAEGTAEIVSLTG
jgi:hypothetical protein